VADLIRFENVSLAFGLSPILANANFSIENGERVCLIGRNGSGKTSLLRLITGDIEPDKGDIYKPASYHVAILDQTLPDELDITVSSLVELGLSSVRRLAVEYERRAQKTLDAQGLKELERLHTEIDVRGGWNVGQRVNAICSEMSLPPKELLRNLSGGWRRRAALAKALISNPNLLLLDEPTNHLDFEAIEWLERKVDAYSGAILFITHDRAFLQRLATRIIEIDRGTIKSFSCNYKDYLKEKRKARYEEKQANAEFDRQLAAEEQWIRQGIKARRTRNEGRVRSLQAMREVHSKRIPISTPARVHIEEADSSGRKVLDVKKIHYQYGAKPLIKGFSLKITRGDRIGLIGNNGVGKSTLLKLLLGEIQPQSGTVKLGTNIKLGFFDQYRRNLDPDKTVAEVVGDGKDYIILGNKPRHVVGYLRGFLFSPKRAMTPVHALSGGEKNRILLAKLFAQPANLLILDEPTNDLDIETLEVVQDRISEYKGTLIVVSHDREFLDAVVDRVVVFEEGGQIREYVGGYSDWARRDAVLAIQDELGGAGAEGKTKPQSVSADKKSNKLTYKLQRELDGLPVSIELLEREVQQLNEKLSQPGFYEQPFEETEPILTTLLATKKELDVTIARWVELEELKSKLSEGD
tara:strand:- start:596 stop:2509 length:1914 start_codon:yes stop_codon:yes gene_type:complete